MKIGIDKVYEYVKEKLPNRKIEIGVFDERPAVVLSVLWDSDVRLELLYDEVCNKIDSGFRWYFKQNRGKNKDFCYIVEIEGGSENTVKDIELNKVLDILEPYIERV